MTKQEALKELKELQDVQDYEVAHIHADEVLVELLIWLGHEDVAKEYEKINKWYS